MITLSRRQWLTYCLWISGASRAQIAESLMVSQNTAETYIRRIMARLEVHTVIGAAKLEHRVTRPDATHAIDM